MAEKPSEKPVVAGQKRKSKAEDGDGAKASNTKKAKKPLDKRFGGKTEEEILQMLLPDHLKPGLDIVFVRRHCAVATGLNYFIFIDRN